LPKIPAQKLGCRVEPEEGAAWPEFNHFASSPSTREPAVFGSRRRALGNG